VLTPIATWNPARDVWEVATTGLFCEHSDAFLETWPSSGMTLRGRAYVLPTWVPRTGASGSSSSPGLLPTPMVSDGMGGRTKSFGKVGGTLPSAVTLLPTPDRLFRGYRVLQEYFSFPEKFLFVDLEGLDRLRGRVEG